MQDDVVSILFYKIFACAWCADRMIVLLILIPQSGDQHDGIRQWTDPLTGCTMWADYNHEEDSEGEDQHPSPTANTIVATMDELQPVQVLSAQIHGPKASDVHVKYQLGGGQEHKCGHCVSLCLTG